MLCVLLCALFLPSCNSEPESPFGIAYNVGAVEGRVTIAGRGIEASVRAQNVEEGWWGHFSTETDSTGTYRLDLPTGTYVIQVDPRPHTDWFESPPVAVGRRAEHVDVAAGSVRLHIAMPPELEGREFDVGAWSDPRNAAHRAFSIAVSQGFLEGVLPVVDPGPNRISIEPSDHSGWSCFVPGVLDPDQAQTFLVSSTDSTVVETAMSGYARIRGEIHGSWEAAGIYPPEIGAWTEDSVYVGRTDARSDGSFSLDLWQARPVKLVSSVYPMTQWFGGESFAQATLFDVHPGEDLDSVSLIESGIRCTLRGPGDPRSFNGQILLRSGTGREVSFYPGNSVANICNLRTGPYALRVFHDCGQGDWASVWYDGADSLSAATPIQVGEGRLTEITIDLETGGAIEGHVLDSAGSPLSWTRVILYDGSSRLCSQWAGAGGTFSFAGLTNGDYRLEMDHTPTERQAWYPGTENPDSAAVLAIRNHETLTGIDWRLLR